MYHVGSMSRPLILPSQVLILAAEVDGERVTGVVRCSMVYGLCVAICVVFGPTTAAGSRQFKQCRRGATNGDRRLLKSPEARTGKVKNVCAGLSRLCGGGRQQHLAISIVASDVLPCRRTMSGEHTQTDGLHEKMDGRLSLVSPRG